MVRAPARWTSSKALVTRQGRSAEPRPRTSRSPTPASGDPTRRRRRVGRLRSRVGGRATSRQSRRPGPQLSWQTQQWAPASGRWRLSRLPGFRGRRLARAARGWAARSWAARVPGRSTSGWLAVLGSSRSWAARGMGLADGQPVLELTLWSRLGGSRAGQLDEWLPVVGARVLERSRTGPPDRGPRSWSARSWAARGLGALTSGSARCVELARSWSTRSWSVTGRAAPDGCGLLVDACRERSAEDPVTRRSVRRFVRPHRVWSG